MSTRINLALVCALAALPHPVFAANIKIPPIGVSVPANATFLPRVNIDNGCREEVAAANLGMRSSAYQGCVRDERTAFQQLRRRWTHYSAQARATCLWPRSGMSLSYVAVQTCLQMQPGGKFAIKGEHPGGLYSWTMPSAPSRTGPPSP